MLKACEAFFTLEKDVPKVNYNLNLSPNDLILDHIDLTNEEIKSEEDHPTQIVPTEKVVTGYAALDLFKAPKRNFNQRELEKQYVEKNTTRFKPLVKTVLNIQKGFTRMKWK